MKKRAAGEGTLSQLPSGNWRAQVRVNGKRISHTAKSQQGARDWIRKFQAQIDAGYKYDDKRITVKTFIEGWLASRKNQMRPATVRSFNERYRNYIKPHLGNIRLSDLSPATIQNFYDTLAADGMNGGSLHIIHAVLRLCLERATKLGMISRNPTILCHVSRSKRREMKVWTEQQVFQFLEYIKGDRHENLFYLALITGMRRGELLGLKWIDVDWVNRRLMVQRQCFDPDGGGFIFQEPKSKLGIRNIQLGRGAIEHLRAQLGMVDVMRRFAGKRWNEYDLIFPNSLGKAQVGDTVTEYFKRLIRASGLPLIRLHDCRHTAATIMLSHGIPPVIVAGILGHSMNTLISNYAHFMPNKQDEAAQLMDDITRPIPVELKPRRV